MITPAAEAAVSHMFGGTTASQLPFVSKNKEDLEALKKRAGTLSLPGPARFKSVREWASLALSAGALYSTGVALYEASRSYFTQVPALVSYLPQNSTYASLIANFSEEVVKLNLEVGTQTLSAEVGGVLALTATAALTLAIAAWAVKPSPNSEQYLREYHIKMLWKDFAKYCTDGNMAAVNVFLETLRYTQALNEALFKKTSGVVIKALQDFAQFAAVSQGRFLLGLASTTNDPAEQSSLYSRARALFLKGGIPEPELAPLGNSRAALLS
jgi:hypothetical protein